MIPNITVHWTDLQDTKGSYQLKTPDDVIQLQENLNKYKTIILEKDSPSDSVVDLINKGKFDLRLIDEERMIDFGWEAEIYEVPQEPDKVLRVMYDLKDSIESFKVKAVKYLRKMNMIKVREFDHVVNVFLNKYINKYDVIITVIEKLEPISLSIKEQHCMSNRALSSFREEIIRDDEYNVNFFVSNPDEFHEIYETYLNGYYDDKDDFEYTDKVKDIIIDVLKGYGELLEIDIIMKDLHYGNVMYDKNTGKYKLIDVVFF